MMENLKEKSIYWSLYLSVAFSKLKLAKILRFLKSSIIKYSNLIHKIRLK